MKSLFLNLVIFLTLINPVLADNKVNKENIFSTKNNELIISDSARKETYEIDFQNITVKITVFTEITQTSKENSLIEKTMNLIGDYLNSLENESDIPEEITIIISNTSDLKLKNASGVTFNGWVAKYKKITLENPIFLNLNYFLPNKKDCENILKATVNHELQHLITYKKYPNIHCRIYLNEGLSDIARLDPEVIAKSFIGAKEYLAEIDGIDPNTNIVSQLIFGTTTEKGEKNTSMLHSFGLTFQLFIRSQEKANNKEELNICGLAKKLNDACTKQDPNSIAKALGFKNIEDINTQFKNFIRDHKNR